MKRAIVSGILAVLFAVGASAQTKPNFTGTWTLDAEKSTMPQGNRQGGGNPAPLTIVVEGSKMSISRTMGQSGNTMTTVYMLDGTVAKNTMARGQGDPVEITYTSKWDGAKLVTTIANPRGTSTESRWIEADGTMVVETTRTGPDGTPVTAKLVYKKS